MKNLAFAVLGLTPLFAAVGALAQDIPPPAPDVACTVDGDCPAGSSCLIPECPACDPADPACLPVDCGPGVCIADQPPEQACTSDADCADDQFCAIFPCVAPCDPDDPTCEPVECDGGGVCVDDTAPPSCESDADCEGGDVCMTSTVESCSSAGCACPNDGDNDPANDPPCDCDLPTEPDCTTENYAFCGPRWLDECVADDDCGPGFVCEIADACACSIDSDGNESCECADTAIAEGSCNLVRVECTDDADCSDGFLCVDESRGAPCGAEDNGDSTCEAPAPTKVCAPPGYDLGPPAATEGGYDRAADGDDGDAADDHDHADGFALHCAQGSAAGLAPLAALGVLLLRRRRR